MPQIRQGISIIVAFSHICANAMPLRTFLNIFEYIFHFLKGLYNILKQHKGEFIEKESEKCTRFIVNNIVLNLD